MKCACLYWICLIFLFPEILHAQCPVTINSFPHLESFETTNGTWTSGGTSSSWAWGNINKPVITSAGGGSKGWVTGGVSGSSYNDGERSWVQSPCFNLSSLTNPVVSFKIFWETERQYDGAGFEYSINGGNTWNVLGAESSNTNCNGENWFNYSPIRYLGDIAGWSGNIQSSTGSCLGGNGSGGWRTAKHTLSTIAGATNVKFRFTFGAGTQCNEYDGFAFDDFRIEETPANLSDFSYTCTTENTVSFSSISRICQTGTLWNFDDPASGAANQSTETSPSHTFSTPGEYTVTLTSSFRNGPPSVTNKIVRIIDAGIAISFPITCNGGLGGLIAAVNPVNPLFPLNYSWNNNPPQSANSLTNVPAGNYEVIISGANTCSITREIELTQPTPIVISLTPQQEGCLTPGSIITNVTGGNPPYSYQWSNGATTANISNLNPGNYSLQVRDASGCQAISNTTINSATNDLNLVPSVIPAQCGLPNGAISLVVSGGIMPYSYSWSNGLSTSSISNLLQGNYQVTVTDAGGCTITSGNIEVTPINTIINFNPIITPASCNGANGAISITPSGGTEPYTFLWSNGETTSQVNNLLPGSYSVEVTDNNGCSAFSGLLVLPQNNPEIIIQPSISPAICSINNGSIDADISGGTQPYTYLWSDGSSESSIQNLESGVYSLIVTDANGCTGTSQLLNVPVIQNTPNVNLGNHHNLCSGQAILLNPGNFSSYIWQDGSTASSYSVTSPGTYSVIVKDNFGCTGSGSIQIEKKCIGTIYFPTAFTPNGDNLNDLFGASGDFETLQDFELLVYGRWGQLVFQTNDPNKKWDGLYKGKIQNTQTFVWVASYTFNNLFKQVDKGVITLIR